MSTDDERQLASADEDWRIVMASLLEEADTWREIGFVDLADEMERTVDTIRLDLEAFRSEHFVDEEEAA